MSEQEFSDLRRAAMANRVARMREDIKPRIICAICEKPLYLSRYIREEGNRWFAHDGASPECPWYEGNKLSPDMRRALIYRGEQEGQEHRRIKSFLVTWLSKEPGVSDVNPEQVTHGQILKGEWKRPDVQCFWGDKHIVFEIQLSYTFLSDVIRRDEFYRKEGIFIIWVFNTIDKRRAVVMDELHFNHRNLFAIDVASVKETESQERLTFNGHFQRPTMVRGEVDVEWDSRWITLDDVTFPTSSYRPYFFDYESEKRALEEARAEALRKADQERCELETARAEAHRKAIQARQEEEEARRQEKYTEFQDGAQRYLSAAIAFHDNDHSSHHKSLLLDAAEVLKQHSLWKRGYEVLFDPRFYGWHSVLPVLLSIKHNRPVGYLVDSAYRVLEAGLRRTSEGKRYGFAVLYLWACKAYQPALSARQQTWVAKQAEKIKNSIKSGDTLYRRFTAYDEAICLLFPELEPRLVTLYATDTAD